MIGNGLFRSEQKQNLFLSARGNIWNFKVVFSNKTTSLLRCRCFKLLLLFSIISSWLQLQKIWDASVQTDVGNEETDLTIKNLFWRNILSNRQIVPDIEEKWANQGTRIHLWRNQSHLSFLIKQMETMPRNHKQPVT